MNKVDTELFKFRFEKGTRQVQRM